MPEITIWGGMPRPADIRFTNNGKPWATFSLADSARYKDDQGVWQSRDESYIDVVVWGDEAEIVGQFEKGTQLACFGRFVTRKFEQDGKQRSVLQFKATKVARLVKAQGGGSQARTAPNTPAQQSWPAQPVQAAQSGGDVWGAPDVNYPAEIPF